MLLATLERVYYYNVAATAAAILLPLRRRREKKRKKGRLKQALYIMLYFLITYCFVVFFNCDRDGGGYAAVIIL